MSIDPADELSLISRRMLIGGAMAMGATMAMPALAASAAPESPLPREAGIPADEKSRIDIIRRVRLRTDPGLVFWFFRGRNYAQQSANLIPLCELNFGAVMMVQPNADGTMDVTQYELGFRTAPGSATFAEKLHNPVTGEMVETPFAPVGPTAVHYDARNVLKLPDNIGGSNFTLEHVPELFYHVGDTIAIQTHSRARAMTAGKADRVLNDMSMICSPANEALSSSVHFASATAHGTDVTDYARWWKMPAGSGTQTLRSFGKKVATFAEMPDDWRAMLARFDPVMAADPIAGLRRKALEYRN